MSRINISSEFNHAIYTAVKEGKELVVVEGICSVLYALREVKIGKLYIDSLGLVSISGHPDCRLNCLSYRDKIELDRMYLGGKFKDDLKEYESFNKTARVEFMTRILPEYKEKTLHEAELVFEEQPHRILITDITVKGDVFTIDGKEHKFEELTFETLKLLCVLLFCK